MSDLHLHQQTQQAHAYELRRAIDLAAAISQSIARLPLPHEVSNWHEIGRLHDLNRKLRELLALIGEPPEQGRPPAR